jgi:hypothetical protein
MNTITRAKTIPAVAGLLILTFSGGNLYARQTSEASIAGVWQGTVRHPKMGEVEFYFTIDRKDAGSFMAKVDIPAQKARNIPVNEVRFTAPDLILDMSSFGFIYEGKAAEDLSGISGRLKTGDEILPLDLRRSAGVPEANRPQDPRKPYPYEEIEVDFQNREADITLFGTLTRPSGQGPFPGVVLISGSGPQDRDSTLAGHRTFLVLADSLTRRGIAVLRFDDRGVGRSQGDFHKATAADFASDAQAAWAFMSRQPRIDAKNIGLVGHSEGGIVAPMTAAKNQAIAFVVLLAGTGIPGERLALIQGREISRSRGAGEEAISKEARMNEQLFRVFETRDDSQTAEAEMRLIIAESLAGMSDVEKKELNVSEGSLLQDMKGYLADYSRARFFLAYDPAIALRKLSCPVLALNGDKDTQVPADANLPAIEQALKLAGNTNVQIKRMPGLNHLFQTAQTGHPREYGKIEETISPAVLQLVGDWILQAHRSR